MNINLFFVIYLSIFGCLHTIAGEVKITDFIDHLPKSSELKVGDITFVVPAAQLCLTDRYECKDEMSRDYLDWKSNWDRYKSRVPVTCDHAIECKLLRIWEHPVSEYDRYNMLEFEPTDQFTRSLYPSIFMSTLHWDATVDLIINELKQTKGYKEQVNAKKEDERKVLQLKLDKLQKRKSKLNNKIKEKEKELNEAFTAGDSQLYLRIKKEIKDLKDKVQLCKEDITSVNTKIEKLKG